MRMRFDNFSRNGDLVSFAEPLGGVSCKCSSLLPLAAMPPTGRTWAS